MANAGGEPVSLEHLLDDPEAYSGQPVVTSGRLLSYTLSEFWLVSSLDDIPRRRGVRLVHPDLDALLFDNVPALSGRYAYCHPAEVAGVVWLDMARSPGVEVGSLSALVITLKGRTYDLLGLSGTPI